MPRELKVYGWTGYRYGMPNPAPRSHNQSREIVAAHSVAEVLRVAGISRRDFNWTGCETGNEEEIAVATAKPGTVFYRPLDHRTGDWIEEVK